MSSIFPEGFYNNTTVSEDEVTSSEPALLKDFKINYETGELLVNDNKDFIIVTGLDAVINIARRKLLIPRFSAESNKGYICYDDDYGSRMWQLHGKIKSFGDKYAEQFIREALIDGTYITNVTDFSTELIEGGYTIKFTIVSIYGNSEEDLDVKE